MAEVETKPEPEPIPRLNFTQLRQAFQNVGIKITKRSMQSYDYVANTSGWKIDANGDVEFNSGTFRGLLIIGTLLGARVQIAGNDITLYDDTTGGGGTITGDTASIKFLRTDGGTGGFFIQKRAGKNDDDENVLEMFYDAAAGTGGKNYIFIGRDGVNALGDTNYTDIVALHGVWDVRAEINRVNDYGSNPSLYIADYNKLDASKLGVISHLSGEGRDGYSSLGYNIETLTFSGATSFAVGDTITGDATGATALVLYRGSSTVFYCAHTSYGTNFNPATDNTCTTNGSGGGSGTGNLSSISYGIWYSAYVDKSLNLVLGSNFIPDADNSYDIGSASFRIKDLHVGGTIYGGSSQALTLLKSGSGTSTSAVDALLDSIAISGLTALDTLEIYFTFSAVTQAPVGFAYIYNQTDGKIIARLGSASAQPAAGSSNGGSAIIRQDPTSSTVVWGTTTTGGAATTGITTGSDAAATGRIDGWSASVTTPWTSPWTAALRFQGIGAGGTFHYSWAIYKRAGQ